MNTYFDVIGAFRPLHDFDKGLGQITRTLLIQRFAREYDMPSLKVDLKECLNLNQMINVIEQKTGILSKNRTDEELEDFEEVVQRIIKFARV